MAETTNIAWTDVTFNPWIGCSHAKIPGADKPHPGCLHCYACAQSARFGVKWGPNGTRRKTSDAYWRKPLKWNRDELKRQGRRIQAPKLRRPRVFPSLMDPFEDRDGPILDHHGDRLCLIHGEGHAAGYDGYRYVVARGRSSYACMAEMDHLRRDFFALIDQTPNLDWILLTKRPQNIRRMWPSRSEEIEFGAYAKAFPLHEAHRADCSDFYRPNVWILYSASDQESLESGLPHLLACRDLAPVIGLSLEPLIAPIAFDDEYLQDVLRRLIDWVIIGGESGPKARPCPWHTYIRPIVQQCQAANVPVFVKQLGSHTAKGLDWQHPKGADPSEWPEDLRVQQYPFQGATI